MPSKKPLAVIVASFSVILGSLAITTPLRAEGTEKVLYSFCGAVDHCAGFNSFYGVIFDTAGNLYGTTVAGGANDEGTVFELIPNGGVWTEQTLYSFCPRIKCADGSDAGGVIFGAAGNLYGTTYTGGAYNHGTVFELVNNNGAWTEKVLHSFTGGNDGSGPVGGLVLDASGNLYGTTLFGGAYHGGTVFELMPNNGTWTEKALHWFREQGKGGFNPNTTLVLDKSGNIYGTTPNGGTYGHGIVFELMLSNGHWMEKPLHSFNMNSKGGYTPGGVILDSAGNLYGTNSAGGLYGGGTAFELVPTDGTWTLKVLVAFKPNKFGPVGLLGLTLGKSGNLFGATGQGGTNGLGTVFELIPNKGTWSRKLVFSFNQDANEPVGWLTLDASGNLYGITHHGGTDGFGVVYEITP
jgi:uncharacterized repeat protein (TIGR03803 family)